MTEPLVFDDVLPDPDAYRSAALARAFQTVDVGAQFHGIALGGDATLPALVTARCPWFVPTLTFLRQSPAGQIEPNYIHTDCDMGDVTAILYLTPDPPEGDGTTFWRHRATGQIATQTGPTGVDNLAEVLAWRDLALWEPWHQVAARYNRVVVFPAAYYHSRSIEANYGVGASARLTQVLFGTLVVVPQEAA